LVNYKLCEVSGVFFIGNVSHSIKKLLNKKSLLSEQ